MGSRKGVVKMNKEKILGEKIIEMLCGDPTGGVYSMYVCYPEIEQQR